jgi:hypothetical protein
MSLSEAQKRYESRMKNRKRGVTFRASYKSTDGVITMRAVIENDCRSKYQLKGFKCLQ